MDSLETQSVNIVLTTYHTVSAEWRSGSKSDQSILFSTNWKRIVLDEGRITFITNTVDLLTYLSNCSAFHSQHRISNGKGYM